MSTDMLNQIEAAITRLLNGEQQVSISISTQDGGTERVDYSAANMQDLLRLKDHYQSQHNKISTFEVEVRP